MIIQGIPAFKNRDTNPYNSFLYEAIQKAGHEVIEGWDFVRLPKSDIVHIHWPEGCVNQRTLMLALVALLWMLARAIFAKFCGCKIIWTIHNIGTHDQKWPLAERLFYATFPRLIDGCIYLNTASRTMMTEVAPGLSGTPSIIVPHGHYREGSFKINEKSVARRSLGLKAEQKVFVYFGQVRPYKNIPQLIRAFKELGDPDARLIVAGNPGRNLELRSDIESLSTNDSRVRLILQFLSEAEISELAAASDVVVLPYSEISNSGSLVLALSHERRVVAPDNPAFQEMATLVGSEWLHLFKGQLSGKILSDSIAEPPTTMAPNFTALDWSTISANTARFYERCLRETP